MPTTNPEEPRNVIPISPAPEPQNIGGACVHFFGTESTLRITVEVDLSENVGFFWGIRVRGGGSSATRPATRPAPSGSGGAWIAQVWTGGPGLGTLRCAGPGTATKGVVRFEFA